MGAGRACNTAAANKRIFRPAPNCSHRSGRREPRPICQHHPPPVQRIRQRGIRWCDGFQKPESDRRARVPQGVKIAHPKEFLQAVTDTWDMTKGGLRHIGTVEQRLSQCRLFTRLFRGLLHADQENTGAIHLWRAYADAQMYEWLDDTRFPPWLSGCVRER